MRQTLILLTGLLLGPLELSALDNPHSTAEPQKPGWPLSAEERAFAFGAKDTTPGIAGYNYDTMRGRPEIERALLDAMKQTSH